MDFLSTVYLGNSVREWMVSLAITLVTYVVLRLFAVRAVVRLAAAAARTRTKWDDVVTDALQSTNTFLLLVIAAFAGANGLSLPGQVMAVLRSATIIAVIVQVGLWISTGLTSWLAVRAATQKDDPSAAMTMNVIGIAVRIALWSVVFLLALDNMGIDVTALVAGLGIGGIAVALAAQNILGDLFASVSIVLDKPFILGDFLAVGDFLGSVEAIGLKTTRLRSLSGEQVVFSNKDLLDSRIRNYGRMYQRRVVLQIGVTYQTGREGLKEIPEIIQKAIEEHGDHVRFDRCHLSSYDDSAISFEAVYIVLDSDYALHMDIKQAVYLRVHEQFDERGIEFAYPTQTVFVERS